MTGQYTLRFGEQLKVNVLLNETPDSLSDTSCIKELETIRQTYPVDQLEALDAYGYYLLGRKENETDLFGLFMGDGKVAQTLPLDYNRIKRYPNTDTFEVWKDGKAGYYNSEF
ncbi:hypothetical protein G3567_02515 [Psychroflexus sp. YR1-1]|uniref:Uncharacterized protein n=1 Tax=Psychroflexus aurantiacus TaxID=2709310 RepID=A0A6B3QY29_9FLAO|nr:hypothetical protein [Psychroflexus aurantiacus]NEV93019.1 hypothetical protein [Psychroflexus aurantiacus]